MKRFEYTLENVLKLRAQTEDERLSDFSSALQKYNEHLQMVERIDAEIDTALEAFQRDSAAKIAARKHGYLYLEHLRGKKEKQRSLLLEAGRVCEGKRHAFKKAQISRKTLEVHKDKQFGVHREELKREEERSIDEIAVTAFKRRLEL